MEKKDQIVFITHRVDPDGGQERSTLEVLKRLAEKGWQIELVSFKLSGWDQDLPINWQKVPGYRMRPQLLKNLWFSIYTLPIAWQAMRSQQTVVATIGTSSWAAHVRVIQFFHHGFLTQIKLERTLYPNPRTIFHRFYQALFSKLMTAFERWFLPSSTDWIAISNRVADDLRAVFQSSRREIPKLQVIHHAGEIKTDVPVDVQHTEASEVIDPTGAPKILFVGALERKGIGKALNCLAQIKDLNWQFLVVGAGDIERWKEKAAQLDISDRVKFFGAQPSAPFFRRSDIFLFPSVYEPFGLVVTEAISAGLAPIVSRECGAIELWRDREEWLDLSSTEGDLRWVAALRRLIESPDLCAKVGRSARAAVGEWSWDLAATEYEKVFRGVVRE